MAGREPFGLPKTPATPPSAGSTQSLRMAYTTDGTAIFTPVISVSVLPATATYQPVGGSAVTASSLAGVGGNGGAGEPVPKKKRGRPRKYGPDGSMSLALVPASMATAPAPPGVSGPAGTGFTPHVIFVKAGEDVSAKIMSFPQNGTRAVCVLSANGIVSNVTLRQSATSGGTVTHEGRFEILSLSGSFLLSEDGGHRSRTGGLSVSLAGPDGRVLGGSVAGLLTAASPVQIVVGTFDADGEKKPKQQQQQLAPSPPDPSPAPLKLAPTGVAAGPSSPPSRGTLSLSESSGGAPSPPHAGASGGGGGGYGQQQQPVGFPGLSWK
ncbi:AT-hook motif nuclear-localized protein 10 [Zea mays]|nr:AT-hook motif nuclear-localized protein 10 [Zea mays]